MSRVKACRGCFTELDIEDEKCYRCGWKQGDVFTDQYSFKLGDILEKRYLVGNLYYASEEKDIVVYYLYDNLLGIPCMALFREKNSDTEGYVQIAEKLQASKKGREGNLVILDLKKIKDKHVLIFSLENRHMTTETFEWCLEGGNWKNKELKLVEKEAVERENVLSCGLILADKYRILDCIGIGGFGITYLCKDIVLDRYVAIKEYFPAEWAERDESYVAVKESKMLNAFQYGKQCFYKEITIAAKFIHTPHIAAIYDAFEANDTIYMVMEYIDGISIGRLMKIREYKAMECEEVTNIIVQVLDALDAIHDKKIVHSDISPGNILYTEDEKVYLIDMGAAKYLMDKKPSLSAIFLKVEYAAPEQYVTAVEKKPSDEGPWTDLYALGATMYYMLTGEKPTDVISRLNGNNQELGEKLSGKIPIPWIELLQKTMELDRTKRVKSAAELKKEIRDLVKL